MASAKEKLEQYRFLSWLAPFIKPRSTRTNLPRAGNCADRSKAIESTVQDEENYESMSEEDPLCAAEGNGDDDNVSFSVPLQSSTTKKSFDDSAGVSKTTGKRKWTKQKEHVNQAELDFLNAMKKAVVEPNQKGCKDDIDLFGMLVAAEVKKLSHRNQLIAKNQIQNLLFNLQMGNEQTQMPFGTQPQFMWNNMGIPPPPPSFHSATLSEDSSSYERL